MDVTLLYIEECPNWALTEGRLRHALDALGHGDTPIVHVLVVSDEQARELDFRGCPTVRIDGRDPFEDAAPPHHGVTCRQYETPSGLAGSPTLDQLVEALRR